MDKIIIRLFRRNTKPAIAKQQAQSMPLTQKAILYDKLNQSLRYGYGSVDWSGW